MRNTFFGQRGGNGKIKSLITEFLYPRFGPGQMWETMSERIVDRGGRVLLETPVERLVIENCAVSEVVAGGQSFAADQVISSLPLGAVAGMASPAAPADVREAARGLRYRDFLTVALIVKGDEPFSDNWVYVHDPDVKVARIQNYRAWSPAMVPDNGTTSIGMEYFCFEGDDLWSAADDDLVELASEELRRTGLYGAEFDLWSVNADSWYSEEQRPEEQPYIRAPAPALSAAVSE